MALVHPWMAVEGLPIPKLLVCGTNQFGSSTLSASNKSTFVDGAVFITNLIMRIDLVVSEDVTVARNITTSVQMFVTDDQ